MKQFILPLITLLIIGSANAQIVYESPHVKDGKTMQLTLPKGYFEVANVSFGGNSMYASREGLDFEVDELEGLPVGMIVTMHVPLEEQTLETFLDELREEMIDDNENVIVIGGPEIVKVKGRDCIYAGLKGEIEEEIIAGVYFGVIEFGDYFIVVTYYAMEYVEVILDYKEFKKIMRTWNEVATEKEDGLAHIEAVFEEDEEFEDFEIYYQNDLFETKISYYDILPDFDENWNEPMDESGHLLSKFTYKEDHGSIKVFSGGLASNYPSYKEMSKAIQLAMDLTSPLTIKYDSEFSNEDHLFKLYSISGGGTKTSVYTTLVNNEMVFFVIDGGSSPIPDFKPAVRDFMLTMWLDYFDELIEESINEK